jgi:tetratricopeptide (TPR) repeat protein
VNEQERFYAELDDVYASQPDAVERFLSDRAAACSLRDGEPSLEYLMCLSELGGYYRGVSRYEDSLRAHKAAEKVIESLWGPRSSQYAVNLGNMAGTYRMMGEPDASLDAFGRAIEIYDELEVRGELKEDGAYLRAGALNNIALLYRDRKEYERSLDCLRSAAALLETDPRLKEELATTYVNLSGICQQTGKMDYAREYLEKALGIFRTLPEDNAHYAAALNAKGALQTADGQFEEARKTLETVLSIIGKVSAENAEYGCVCRNMARLCQRLEQQDEATRYMERAYEIFLKIWGKENETTKDAFRELEELRVQKRKP